MKRVLILCSTLLLITVGIWVLLWSGVFDEDIPAGWMTYENQNIGFTISHPQEMQLSYEREDAVGFALEGPVQDDDLPVGPEKARTTALLRNVSSVLLFKIRL